MRIDGKRSFFATVLALTMLLGAPTLAWAEAAPDPEAGKTTVTTPEAEKPAIDTPANEEKVRPSARERRLAESARRRHAAYRETALDYLVVPGGF